MTRDDGATYDGEWKVSQRAGFVYGLVALREPLVMAADMVITITSTCQ